MVGSVGMCEAAAATGGAATGGATGGGARLLQRAVQVGQLLRSPAAGGGGGGIDVR